MTGRNTTGLTTLPVDATARAEETTERPAGDLAADVLVVRSTDGRPVSVVFRRGDDVVHRPVLDLRSTVAAAPWVTGAIVAGRLVSRWAGAARTTITMGPGGWVSFRDRPSAASSPGRVVGLRRRPRDAEPRPWWARLLRATRYS